MADDSYIQVDDDNKMKYKYTHNHKMVSWKHADSLYVP